ncbi:nicotinate-nucleotide--dimethylbenzimidazole phosphoribosyltransferase [Streptomyces sp. GXMU-J15]|uniref:Nicotinate-nucleotide--dimethylbenzimidazole phosphoribosyltransferase n=1 Tax=Streptomyces fuscus TaxID=3048495 RepID=A0ABT7IXQ4_9ACTN|nr:nicotinate-nucleotide--dimethylbenzimidazole phosphoribosyltransferase [Streptomyces fuscus]MDL2077375.1 nicotinate-nucleotide--dimethylbenzimidazole phosphoribosyltransferase [Streptomyces fuscus]
MTDTGQVPGEGLPENAGMVEQPGVAAPGAYTYLSETTAEDEDLLLLPGAQSAWGNEVAPPAPEPVVEALHEPGAHEMSGRDSGSVDVSAVRTPNPAPVPPVTPPRPLHLGPPTPDTSASPVRSLADRGAVGAPVRQSGPPTAGPEYLDVAQPQPAAPWGAPAPAPAQAAAVPAPAAAPAAPAGAPAPVPVAAEVAAAETVVPQQTAATEPTDPAQAAVARLTGEAVAAPTAEPAAQGVAEAVAQPAGEPGAQTGAPVAEETGAEPVEEPAAGEPVARPAGAPEAAPVQAEPQGDEPTAGPAPQETAAQGPVTEGEPGAEAGPSGEPVADPAAAPEADAEPVPAAEPAQDTEATAPTEAGTEGGDAAPVPAEDATPEAAEVVEGAEAVEGTAPETAPAAEAVVPEAAGPAQPAEPVTQAPAEAGAESVAAAEPAAPVADEPAQTVAEEPVAAEAAPAKPQAAPEAQPAPQAPAPVAAQADAPAVAEEPTAAPEPEAAVAEEPQPEPQPYVAEPAGPQMQPADGGSVGGGVPLAPHPDQPLGQFVPVEGQVPTTPHLAPTPPQPIVLPAEEEAPAVPAPRAGEPEPAEPEAAQNAEDLDTQAAADQDQAETAVPAAEPRQSTGPAAPGYDEAEREAVLKVMRERRDIRNGFRSDPIPHEVLLRVLEAAHTAPSVGHSQPWDFVVIRSAETRRAMHELAMRQREAYAKSLPKGRAKQFKELKIEAILDTPVNIVVTADPTRGGRHTLGRHTQPQMAPYSSALAVENLWLAARAEGLGVGWVSFFDEREMVRALGLPEHLEVVAYLCVGYVDEFPDEPELLQAGWSKRRPLSWVVHEETYGRRALPGEEPHDLLAETVAQIRPLDAKALGEAWERQKRMTKPAGALGMLEIISAQLSGLSRQCPPPIPEPAAVAIFAGDHGVHAQGVTPWPQEVTAQMVANFLGGGAVCNAFAGQVGAEVCVVDVGVAADLPATPGLLPRKVRAGTSDMTTGPAMTREECKQAIEVGIETARDLVAAGNKALLTGEMGIANTTASAALISVFTGADPAEVTGRGTGINDETLARKTEVVRRALEVHQPDPADPIGVLAAIGGFEHAAMVGLLLGGASLRTPVILDGVSAGAAALVARAIAPEVLAACIAGHRSAEPGHVAALNKLGLRPLVDLDLRLGEGTGALLALPLVQSTARAMHEVATFDSAGVTEK